jgi:hypothetical protein
MGTWNEFRTAVQAAVTAAMPAAVRTTANLDGPTVTWTDDVRPFSKHRLLLDVVSTVFNHDRDSALSEGGDQELSSMATITVQVTAESNHDRSSSPGDALWLLEQVRLGLRRVPVADALRTAECPIVGFPAATVRRSYPADGRIISAHSFDVQVRFIFDFDTSEDDPVGQIEHVEAEGEAPGDLIGVEIAVDDPTPDV